MRRFVTFNSNLGRLAWPLGSYASHGDGHPALFLLLRTAVSVRTSSIFYFDCLLNGEYALECRHPDFHVSERIIVVPSLGHLPYAAGRVPMRYFLGRQQLLALGCSHQQCLPAVGNYTYSQISPQLAECCVARLGGFPRLCSHPIYMCRYTTTVMLDRSPADGASVMYSDIIQIVTSLLRLHVKCAIRRLACIYICLT